MENNAKSQTPGNRKLRRITTQDIERARSKLDAFKAAKSGLNQTIRFNEDWYRQRHMEYMNSSVLGKNTMEGDSEPNSKNGETVEPTSAFLFSSIRNYHADYMDSFPRCNILPREPSDKIEAAKLTMIMPVLLDRIKFEAVYSRSGWTKAIQGWTVYTVTWDKEADNGRGDISIGRAKLLNLYWDMEVDQLEDSSDVFYLHERDLDELIKEYPKYKDSLKADAGETEKHDDVRVGAVPTKTTVVDWYYKRKNKEGKRVLHLCQFVGDVILYASENESSLSERGLYDHGKYPFVVDVLYPLEDALHGFGLIAVGSNKQAYIDILSKAIMKNALWKTNPRYFVRDGKGFNADDFLDLRKTIVEVEGSGDLNEDVVPIQAPVIDGTAISLKESMEDDIRETTNLREASTGSAPGGVTAASGIAALQEADAKTSRDSNRTTFRAFREIVTLVIELIRQFYTDEHYFRVTNEETGQMEYIAVDNSAMGSGRDSALFDLSISTEKNSSYSRLAQNELALSFFNAGFFNPNLASSVIPCLKMMDFDGKEEVLGMVEENDQRQQLMQALVEYALSIAQGFDQMLAERGVQSNETANVVALAEQVMGATASGTSGRATVPELSGESSVTKKAREETASAASPT